LFWVILFVTFDCVYFQRSYNIPTLERVNLLQEQVTDTLLDPRNMSDLNCNPPDQHDQGWALLHGMVIAGVDEGKNSDAATDVNDSIENFNDFLVTASAAAIVNSLDLSSAEIADREIKIWKTCTVPFPKSSRRVASQFCAFFPSVVGCVGEAVIRLGGRNPEKKERKACTCYSCYSYNFSSSRALVFHGGYCDD